MLGSRLRDIGGGTVIAIAAMAPTFALMLSREQGLSEVVPVIGLVSYALVLGAAVLTYFHWRLTSHRRLDSLDGRLAGWLVVGLTVAVVDGLLQLTSGTEGDDLRPVVAQLVLVTLLCGMARASERVDVPVDPGVASTLAAATITVAYSVALWVSPQVELHGPWEVLGTTVVTVAGLVLALVLLGLREVSPWARHRLAAAAALFTVGQGTSDADGHLALLQIAAVCAFIGGALTLCAMTYELLRNTLQDQQAEVDLLQRTLAEVRTAVLEDRELLHEVGATVAGIASATQVIHTGQSVPAHRRRRLEEMLVAELGRLGRLMNARTDDGPPQDDALIHLDDVVRPIVVSHQERQRDVVWAPSGQTAHGDPDEVAEVCNILLENAAQHARGAVVRLSVTARDDEIVVVCADGGPGVAAEVRDRIFEAEVRSRGSRGQGLGLAVAHRLAMSRGGSIELLDLEGQGAVFVAHLPRKESAHVAAGHVA